MFISTGSYVCYCHDFEFLLASFEFEAATFLSPFTLEMYSGPRSKYMIYEDKTRNTGISMVRDGFIIRLHCEGEGEMRREEKKRKPSYKDRKCVLACSALALRRW